MEVAAAVVSSTNPLGDARGSTLDPSWMATTSLVALSAASAPAADPTPYATSDASSVAPHELRPLHHEASMASGAGRRQ
jgi:hypothetical protein